MDSALKQRLLGAAVLIALAVIFVPMFLGNAPPKQDSTTVSGEKRQQKDSVTSGATARRSVSQPERSFSSEERYGRRGAGRQSSFARNTGERKVHAFVDSEPQYRTTRRKPRATSAGRLRHEGASNRSASR